MDEAEVEKPTEETTADVHTIKESNLITAITNKEIEKVAESLESCDLTPICNKKVTKEKSKGKAKGSWSRVKDRKVKSKKEHRGDILNMGKRQLVDVMIVEGSPHDIIRSGNKKLKDNMDVDQTLPEGVLDDKHQPS